MNSFIAAIKARRSCRTYDSQSLGQEDVLAWNAFLKANTTGPFGTPVRFELADFQQRIRGTQRYPGTYGVIKGARYYIIGAAKKSATAMEDFGYAMEKNILFATASGLGTCWLGGTFQRTGFARFINLRDDELLPAVSPVGYPNITRSFTDRMFRYMASSDKRKTWKQLFFLNDMETPFNSVQAGMYAPALECVRIGPSASNRQPWRIIRAEDTGRIHFYLRKTIGYGNLSAGISLQNIDMGIAMCHFELAVREMGLNGYWVRQEAEKIKLITGGMEYIATWTDS